jgi:hypothetical protein
MARFDRGWVKLHRKVLESDISTNGHCLAIWTWLLMAASWKEGRIAFNGEQRNLPPGTVIFGVRELAEQLGFSKSTVGRWIQYLAKTQRIRAESGPRGSIATICNWNEYQSDEDDDGTLVGQQRDNSGTIEGPYEESKKVRRNTARKSGGIRATYSEEFEKVWNLYGKVGKKSDASKAFEEWKLTPEEYEHLLKAIPNYIADCRKKERTQQYLGTFLREDWREWYQPAKGNSQDDQAGFDLIRRHNEQALARAAKTGSA